MILVNDPVWGMILAEWVTEVTSLLVQTLNPYPNKPYYYMVPVTAYPNARILALTLSPN